MRKKNHVNFHVKFIQPALSSVHWQFLEHKLLFFGISSLWMLIPRAFAPWHNQILGTSQGTPRKEGGGPGRGQPGPWEGTTRSSAPGGCPAWHPQAWMDIRIQPMALKISSLLKKNKSQTNPKTFRQVA